MSTVISHEACKQCRFPEALGRLDIRTGEASLFCPRCGYRLSVKAAVDRQRQRADPQKRLWLKRDQTGRLILRAREQRGYGAYCFTNSGGASVTGRLTRPLDRQTLRWFKRKLRQDGVDAARCYLTRAEQQRVRLVFGKFPRAQCK